MKTVVKRTEKEKKVGRAAEGGTEAGRKVERAAKERAEGEKIVVEMTGERRVVRDVE
jgi:hypothetical protein